FRHFGKDKVEMDFGILAIAFNLKKLHKRMQLGLKTMLKSFFVAFFELKPHLQRLKIEKYNLQFLSLNLIAA
ncbi:MAG: hypothetical protein ACK5LR_01155, partial [Mangrovibacterium sp.]